MEVQYLEGQGAEVEGLRGQGLQVEGLEGEVGSSEGIPHISLIVSSKVPIWGDDSVDLRFIVLHGELRSKQGALDVFFVIDDRSYLEMQKEKS